MLCYNTRLGCFTRDYQELLYSIRDVCYFLGQSFDRFPSYCFFPTKFYRDFEQAYGIVRKAVCIGPPVIFLFIHAWRNDFKKIDNPLLKCWFFSPQLDFGNHERVYTDDQLQACFVCYRLHVHGTIVIGSQNVTWRRWERLKGYVYCRGGHCKGSVKYRKI